MLRLSDVQNVNKASCEKNYQRPYKFTRNSSGNARPQSSQLAEPLWADPGLKSGIGARQLTST